MVNLTLWTFENQLWGLERSARNTQPCPLPSPFCSSFWPDTHFPIFKLFLKIRVPQGYNVPLGCGGEVQWSSLPSCNFSSVHAWDLLQAAPSKWEDTPCSLFWFCQILGILKYMPNSFWGAAEFEHDHHVYLEKKRQRIPVFLPGEFPWTEEPGRLQSMGSQRVRHDWATNTLTFLFHSVPLSKQFLGVIWEAVSQTISSVRSR